MANFVGTAAWNIPKEMKPHFPDTGITPSHLGRYSQLLNAVEINTSFYRNHQARYYQRWYDETPSPFRFSVKLNKVITHEQKLADCDLLIEQVVPPILTLKEKLGCLLVQLPPKLEFYSAVAEAFFKRIISIYKGPIAIEPRHTTWKNARALLEKYSVSLVYPDPNPVLDLPFEQFGNDDIFYLRLHGSPVIYRSDYHAEALLRYKELYLSSRARQKWCIFDNTTFGYATLNALEFTNLLKSKEFSSGYAMNTSVRNSSPHNPKHPPST